MKRLISIVLIITLVFTSLFAQAVQEEVKKETVSFTDSSGRVVEMPATIDRVAPSGAVATMFLSAFAPEKMCTVSGRPSNAQMAYLPEELASLPETGQMYGSKATLNLEELLASGAELVIDLGCTSGSDRNSCHLHRSQHGEHGICFPHIGKGLVHGRERRSPRSICR